MAMPCQGAYRALQSLTTSMQFSVSVVVLPVPGRAETILCPRMGEPLASHNVSRCSGVRGIAGALAGVGARDDKLDRVPDVLWNDKRKHSAPGGIVIGGQGGMTWWGGVYGGSGMGGIQGLPARASWMAVRTWAPCLAAVEM